MGTLYVDRKGIALKTDGRRIQLYADGVASGAIPVSHIDRVVLHNRATVDTRVLGVLAEHGISMVVLNTRNPGRTAWLHGGNHNDAARRLAQYRCALDNEWRERFARVLVSRKLTAQRGLLKRLRAARPDQRHPLTKGITRIDARLDTLRDGPARDLDALRGFEGAAAAAYFSALAAVFPPSLDFTDRNRRPPRDPVNACLSLTYTLINKEAILACHTAGLDPMIGFFHDLQFARESLACDLVEPLRAQADEWVWTLFRDRQLTADHFSRDEQACLLNKSGRERYFQSYEHLAGTARRRLRRYCRILLRQLPATSE